MNFPLDYLAYFLASLNTPQKISCSFSLMRMRHYLECRAINTRNEVIQLFPMHEMAPFHGSDILFLCFCFLPFTVSSFVATHRLLFSNLTHTLAFTPCYSHISEDGNVLFYSSSLKMYCWDHNRLLDPGAEVRFDFECRLMITTL